jgi:NADPH2:quinone reductase
VDARVITFAAQGDPSVLGLETIRLDPPAAGQALVRQSVIGLNYLDVYQRSGHYTLKMPSGLGSEAAGVVEAVGPEVTEVQVGDRVAYAGGAPGSYADLRNLPAGRLVKVPDGISDEQAAAVLLKGMTVEYLLNRCFAVQAGQWVLFHAAAGGVGLIAGQWGKALGARMIGVARGTVRCQQALAQGYEVVIDRASEDVAARVKALTGGEGVPVVYDSVGQATFEQSIDCLAPRGTFVSFGATTGEVPPVPASLLQHRGSLYFTRPTLVTYSAQRAELEASAAAVFAMVADGRITVEINQRYALAEAEQAHRDLEGGRNVGSSILLP